MKVEIFVSEVRKLTTKTRIDDGIFTTTIQFEAHVPIPSLARLLNLQRQGAPISATLGSPQARMDLKVGEISDPFREHELSEADRL